MLVLGRLKGERIQIGPDIFITVIAVQGSGKVRIGIDAPQSYDISRLDREDTWVDDPRFEVDGAGAPAVPLPPLAIDQGQFDENDLAARHPLRRRKTGPVPVERISDE